jgi:hypothetical protein
MIAIITISDRTESSQRVHNSFMVWGILEKYDMFSDVTLQEWERHLHCPYK